MNSKIFKNTKLILVGLMIIFSISVYANDNNSSSGTQSGLTLKGGLWGLLAAKEKIELEDKYFTDDLLSGFNFGQLNTAWNRSNNIYLLNPIGLDYYISGIGPGSLLLGAEMRGIPGLAFTGYNPKYDFVSINGGGIGLHNADLAFKNLDLNVGYQLAFGQLLVTPKFQFRNFATDLRESGLYLGNNAVGFRETSHNHNTWAGFIGVNLLYKINEASSVYFEFAMDSPILGQIRSSGDFNKLSVFAGNNFVGGSTTLIKNATQEVRGSVIDLGYQHSFGALGLRVGYRGEELRTSYSRYTDVPISFSSVNNNVNIDIEETVLNSIFYKNSTSTILQNIYLAVTYKL
ncbi:MAG: hypothetical protein KBF93_17690 [Leptospiraceae bacterium]|nr:hypothetical protein [Leptospiraceae bacterium]